MQALFYNAFIMWCLLNATVLFAHNSLWIDILSNEAAQQYVEEFKDIAVIDMHKTGIPASIKLAQAMFESNFGRSDLAIRGNNHFGIKCYKSWKGEKLYYNDDKPNECFRHYDWVEDSYADHSRIITSKRRYSSLFELASIDYEGWAKGLQKAGYATDPQYAKKLIWMIEKHNLHEYDFEESPIPYEEDMPLIANAEDVFEPSEIIYAYKFGDVEKAAPNKLKIKKINGEKLIRSNTTKPKTDLLNSSIESFGNEVLIASKETIAPKVSEQLEEKPIVIKRDLKSTKALPQQYAHVIESLEEKNETNPIFFQKRALPKMVWLIEKEPLIVPSVLHKANTPKNIVWANFDTEQPQNLLQKRRVPIYDFSIPLENLEEVSSLQSKAKTATPKIEKKVMEATIANPSATTDVDISVLLAKKEFTYSNKLKVVQYEKPVQLSAIAQTYQITIEELKRYNDLEENAELFPKYTPIYMEAKKNKPSENHQKAHAIQENETMWTIAQLYGIQLKELLKRNYLKTGQEPHTGEIILLRSQAPYPPMIRREKPKAKVSEFFKQSVLEQIQKKKRE